MLRHLRVTNFAILSDVEIELGTGLNVLTGETGAGKSLIVEAVNLLRGGRASADIPRAGTDEAVVEAIVEVPADLSGRVAAVLEGGGLPPSSGDGDHEVFIRRVIQRGGRSRTYVNGALTTATRLAELGALLIDLSGQHQHQGLVDPSRHLELLDAFARAGDSRGRRAGAEEIATAWPLAETMAAAWDELRRCDDELASLGGDERAREARIDYLRYQLEELDGASLVPGEDATLEIERARLASVDQLQGAARAAEDALYGGDDSARDRVAIAAREVERARRAVADPALEGVAKQLAEIETLIDDTADSLRNYADRLEGDPERLALLDERLALIRRLLRKHAAGALDDVIDKAAALRSELDGLVGRESRLADLTQARVRAEAAAWSAAAALTQAREKAARKLEKLVASALAELGMGSAKLTVAIDPREHRSETSGSAEPVETSGSAEPAETTAGKGRGQRVDGRTDGKSRGEVEPQPHADGAGASQMRTRGLGPTGADRVELMLCSNKGEDARPLAKIASGGELSRIMLALKLGLQSAGRAEPVATYVFDEVDSGIGGAAAQVVGSQIRAVASGDASRQVLCVTHLPQIAAYADHHFHVEKTEVGGRIETHVRRLTTAQRKDELARMLGGSVTQKAKAHAAELLAEAARPADKRARV